MSERALSQQSVFAARPTVQVNGALKARLARLLIGMDLCEHEDGLSALELRLTNVVSEPGRPPGFAFEDEQNVKLGDALIVYTGEETAPHEVFRGVVTGLEADFGEESAPALVILAEDGLQRARMHRRTRTWDQCNVAQVVREIAGQLGLTPRITGLTEDLGTQVQFNESDLAFLRRLLARRQADVQVVGTELHASPRRDVDRGTITLVLHRQLRRACVLADLTQQVTEVTVTGWDAARGERIVGRSSTGPLGPGRGRSGSELLRHALGERPHHLSHLAVADAAEAEALAEAALTDRLRRFVTIEGTAEGNPALRVGTQVAVEGMGPRFSNTYYLTRCRHRYDLERGYETDFTAVTPFLGSP